MRICKRAVDFVQVINENGDVRLCSWLYDGGVIGRLTEKTMKEIYHSKEAELIQEYHCNGNHSNCNPNACPYVANGTVKENEIEIDKIPEYPESLYLAYENVCNYRCVMCTIPDCMQRTEAKEREKKLQRIDEELEKILPYVKNISANGLGELFVSKHTLNLLSKWEPLAKKEECSVLLETNGALFNKENWEKISNLGQYNLSVAITVLSFEEEIYRELSGTALPISNLIDNLHFVKSLREKGIINYFEIATVYQEKNFRELPEFARRCIEEFNVDCVRLRPFEPWRDPDMQEWFRDVRNEYHPYNKEFLQVMKDPIFKHPKVHDWGGGKASGLGPEPYTKMRARYSLLESIFCKEGFMEHCKQIIKTDAVVIYAMAVVGRALVSVLKDEYTFDNISDTEYDGIQIIHRSQLKDKINATVVIFSCDEPLKQNLAKEFSENGMKYVFAMDLLGCTTVTGLEIKKNGVKGYWHYGTNEVFYHDTLPDNLQISFQGAHSSVYIGENLIIDECRLLLGNRAKVKIGNNVRIVIAECHVAYSSMNIGDDCLFGKYVVIRTHDSHHIFDKDTGKRINQAKNVNVSNQVWLCAQCKLLPGADIGVGSVVAANAVTSSKFPNNVIIAGVPAKVIRENIVWSRDDTRFCDYQMFSECSSKDAEKYIV